MKIDLHIHSTASDGKVSPEELVDLAVEKKLSVIAVTDHDVLSGSKRAVEYARDKDIEVVSGVEFGTQEGDSGLAHIVGLGVDLEDEKLNELSDKLIRARATQKKDIILKLNELGYDISFEELQDEVEGENYGRPHIARILMRKYDELKNIQQVFDELLGRRGKANVFQWTESIKNTIDVIHDAGGVAILAHPMLYHNYEKIIELFVENGGDGIEVDYFYENRGYGNQEELIKRIQELAEKHDLIVSGGGDFHCHGEGCEIGDYGVSEEEFEKLKGHWGRKWKKI